MFEFIKYLSARFRLFRHKPVGGLDKTPSVHKNLIFPVMEHIIHFPILNNNTKSSIINIKYTTVNGLLDGYHLLYDRNGKLLSKSHYRQGELDGEQIHYDSFLRSTEGFEKYYKSVTLYSNGICVGNELLIKKRHTE
jgi:hypothetical protein